MSQKRLRDRIVRRAKTAGVDLPPETLDGLEIYFSELGKWNRKINLTALDVTGDGSDDAVDRLLIEPLLAARVVPAKARRVLDAGSGGGSPAIPLKLARPDIALTMVEVKVRKSVFLRQAARLLKLTETTVETSRFEELLARPDLHESFDIVTVRAVKIDRSTLLGLQAFLRAGGLLLNFTTADVADAPPPLVLREVLSLVSDNSSRLAVFEKRLLGGRST